MEQDQSDIHQFKRRKPSIYYLILINLIVLVVFVDLWPRALVGDSLASIFLSVLMPLMLATYLYMLYVYLRSGYMFVLKNNGIEFMNIFGKWYRIEYSEMKKLQISRINRYDFVLRYKTAKGVKSVFLNTILENFGELIETILDKAINLEELPVKKKLLEIIESDWGKAPNWIIINNSEQRIRSEYDN